MRRHVRERDGENSAERYSKLSKHKPANRRFFHEGGCETAESLLVTRPTQWQSECQVIELSIQCVDHLFATNWLN